MNNVNLDNMWVEYDREMERMKSKKKMDWVKFVGKIWNTYKKIYYHVFTTKDVANMLQVDEETVRRWCRSGELKAFRISKKEGFNITYINLNRFINEHPKYAKRIAKET